MIKHGHMNFKYFKHGLNRSEEETQIPLQALEELYFDDEEPGVQTPESPDPGRLLSVFATQKTILY